MSAYVRIQYSDFDGTYVDAAVADGHTIRFDKSGACVEAVGVINCEQKIK